MVFPWGHQHRAFKATEIVNVSCEGAIEENGCSVRRHLELDLASNLRVFDTRILLHFDIHVQRSSRLYNDRLSEVPISCLAHHNLVFARQKQNYLVSFSSLTYPTY